ncbi:MAG: septum formation inhibitor Maf [Deltaproteobacteria bacterium]|nr:septum formation inhibitor Maf [Deltaproteobacteria bacterium]
MEKPLPLILASGSPRRKELLTGAGLEFSIIVSDVDEDIPVKGTPAAHAKHLAEIKASAVAELYPESFVIGADTIVVVDGDILGKPASEKEAERMLDRLSGRAHIVHTGWCIICRKKGFKFSGVEETLVQFKNLSPDEIKWYVKTGEPMDKTGAYAIQDKGAALVKSVVGSYTNVVGLPLCEVVEVLEREGFRRRGR